MIVKPYEDQMVPRDARAKAGAAAERQMAHYLHRRFRDDPTEARHATVSRPALSIPSYWTSPRSFGCSPSTFVGDSQATP